jgi:hypothetical protein
VEQKVSGPIIVRTQIGKLEYYACPIENGYKFTVNDGYTPGHWAQLPTEEFWSAFEFVRKVKEGT